ncbi:hypothetical protein M569_04800, partial [Genlisea aurea]
IILFVAFLSVLTLSSGFVPFPAQDFCVASQAAAAGFPVSCKDPLLVTADDFFAGGLHIAGNTTNPFRASITALNLALMPGLNTLGLTIARLDLAAGGFVPPHTHPRATEILSVIDGSLEVGFISSSPGNRLFKKILHEGDSFVVPVGLVHYQRNAAAGNTVAFVAVNNPNPGIIAIPSTLFGATPDLAADYLSGALQLDVKIVEELLAKF